MALARALAVEPKVLLLDEPFGALDANVREELRAWLRRLHDEVHVTTVFVTHDQEEAMELADQIVVLNEGGIEQVGAPRELYEQPANEFVMGFVGAVTRLGDGLVRPHDLEILDRARRHARVEAQIDRIVHLGFEVRVELTLADERTCRRRPRATGRAAGARRGRHRVRAQGPRPQLRHRRLSGRRVDHMAGFLAVVRSRCCPRRPRVAVGGHARSSERPSVLTGNPVLRGGTGGGTPALLRRRPAAAAPPVHGGQRRLQHPRRRLPDRHRRPGRPLGRATERVSTFYGAECASVTFDSHGRIETICVGVQRPTLKLLDPVTLDELASYDLPPRQTSAAGAFTDFSGGGYFYLDNRDRAVVPTSDRHLLVIGQHDGHFAVDRDYDLTRARAPGRQADRRPCPTGRGGSG